MLSGCWVYDTTAQIETEHQPANTIKNESKQLELQFCFYIMLLLYTFMR